MNQALATQKQEVATVVDVPLLTSYLDAMGLAKNLSGPEKEQFLQIAQAYGLNPFKREIYCSKYGEGQYAQFAIIVGYEVYIKRAERSGKLDGWECQFDGEGNNLSCTVTIYRKDWARPFKHTAWYEESVQKTKGGEPTKFWQKKRLMTRKVAISQAFRMCFSDELGGMPYTSDELGVDVQDTTATAAGTVTSGEQTYDAVPVEKTRMPNKRNAAEAMKAHQATQAAPAPTADLVYEEDLNPPTGGDFVLDYIDEWASNIERSTDDESWNWNEEQISADERIPQDERVALLKRSIIHRTNKVTTVEEATAIRKRIGGFYAFIGEANGTALLNDLIEQARANGMDYVDKKFVMAREEVVNG